jgi:hypothetical protein
MELAMDENPLNSLHSPEQIKTFERRRLFSYFFPFKYRRLNQVEKKVKGRLNESGISFPIAFDFKYPNNGSKYGIALVDSHNFSDYRLYINYNPRLITLDFTQLYITGLHEYSHFIYRQKDYLKLDYYCQFFQDIQYELYIESIENLTNVFVENNLLQIPDERKDLLKNPRVIEDYFAEGFARYLAGYHDEILIREKEHIEFILKTHILLMKKIRRILYSEP